MNPRARSPINISEAQLSSEGSIPVPWHTGQSPEPPHVWHFEAGYVPPHHSVESFAQAIRAIGEPIHNRAAEDISMAKLLMLLFEVTGLFDMRTRPELLLLQKTMVVVEGVGRSLDPKLDIWTAAEPVVREWMERHLGPVGRIEDVAQGAGEVGRFVGQMPAMLGRAARIADQLDAATPGTSSRAAWQRSFRCRSCRHR